ncbi:MAG: methyltransferase domain-containing protein [Candidatus Schekmanbacteria bacterium]|nr:methyltransferase domain-containing protein [Candidatus Schekmanbacteria bacterium]
MSSRPEPDEAAGSAHGTQAPGTRAHRRWLFDVGADIYALLTWQEPWRAHCRSMVDHFPGGTARILDLGIGPGVSGIAVLERLPRAQVVGLDFSSRMLRQAQRYTRRGPAPLALVQADATHLPFPDGSFDVVMAHSFLYLLTDACSAVAEARRVLRPGGRAVFLEPAGGGSASWVLKSLSVRFAISMALWRAASRHAGRFSEATLRELLEPHLVDVATLPTLGGLGLIGLGARAEARRHPSPPTVAAAGCLNQAPIGHGESGE